MNVRAHMLTFPRSGTFLTRFYIEWYSGRPTPGRYLGVVDASKCNWVMTWSHNPDSTGLWGLWNPDGTYRVPRLLVILRDLRECWWGQLAEYVKNPRNAIAQYKRMLEAYRQVDIPKLLVYYEDIMADTPREMATVLKFLDIPAASVTREPAKAAWEYRQKIVKRDRPYSLHDVTWARDRIPVEHRDAIELMMRQQPECSRYFADVTHGPTGDE